jgi:hypothetical protein
MCGPTLMYGPPLQHAFPAPPPKGRRRWGLLIAGIVAAIFGLIVLIGGAVVSMGAAAAVTLDPVAKARTPDVMTFDAETGRYDPFAVHERRKGSIGSAASFDCTVTLADGDEMTIDGAVQAVSEEVANTETIGSFTAVKGETTIECDAGREGEVFIVDKESPWR